MRRDAAVIGTALVVLAVVAVALGVARVAYVAPLGIAGVTLLVGAALTSSSGGKA